jgi:phosphatidylethanolamine-binding protein (PEBP) family uncharacterized protein
MSTLTLAGCGHSGSAVTAVAKVPFASAAILGPSIPARYTCDGKDISPPLQWGTVPPGTGELLLVVVGFTPTLGKNAYSISDEWALAGVNPKLHRLAAGQLPPGTHVGLSSDGKARYSICPKKGTSERYQFELYGIPASIAISPRFVGTRVLTSLDAAHGSAGATAHGAFVVTYRRR